MIKLKIILLIILLSLPTFVFSQAKPTRDKSKDRRTVSVVRKSNNKSNNKVVAKVTTSRRSVKRKKRSNKRNVRGYKRGNSEYRQWKATYLTVDQRGYLSKTFNSFNGSESFYVNTDGKEWETIGIPSWCTVSRFSDHLFFLRYKSNPDHEKRSDYFYVKSDDQTVRIDITQNGVPLNISTSFSYINLSHYYNYGTDYLRMDVSFTIQGAKRQKCMLVAFVIDESDQNIMASSGYSNYALNSGELYVSQEFTPTTDSPETFNLQMYLPNNAMKLTKKKNRLRCVVSVYCTTTSGYVQGQIYSYPFKAKIKKGRVTIDY